MEVGRRAVCRCRGDWPKILLHQRWIHWNEEGKCLQFFHRTSRLERVVQTETLVTEVCDMCDRLEFCLLNLHHLPKNRHRMQSQDALSEKEVLNRFPLFSIRRDEVGHVVEYRIDQINARQWNGKVFVFDMLFYPFISYALVI